MESSAKMKRRVRRSPAVIAGEVDAALSERGAEAHAASATTAAARNERAVDFTNTPEVRLVRAPPASRRRVMRASSAVTACKSRIMKRNS